MTSRPPEPAWTEAGRLRALDRYGILDTPPEQAFDDLVQLAASLLDAPVAAVTLIADRRQWFKSETGLGVRETPLDNSICAHAILQPGGLVVPDTAADPRFARNPMVTGTPGLRFYAGAPLQTSDGLPLGVLCVLDTKPRPDGLTEQQGFALRTLARQVMDQLELRRVLAERDEALAEQRRSAALNRQIIDSVTDYAIVATDRAGRITRWNAGAENVLGWSEAEMLGQVTDRFFTPEDRAAGRIDAELRASLATGRGEDERWHLRKGDRRFWANGVMMPLRTEAGEVTGFVKVLRDRTGTRAAAEALRSSEERYRSLFNNIDAGFCIVELRFDADGRAADYRFLETNPAFERQTGLVDAGGKWMRDLAPAHEQHWFDLYGQVAATGEPVRFENRAAALADRWYDVHAFRVGAPEAQRVAILFNDISRRRRTELAMQHLNDTLEQQVEERTQELRQAEEALRQSQKMEAVGNLTGGLAHDFNNLLTGITGSLELLQARVAQGRIGEVDRYVAAAQGAAKRAAALTHRLLAFSRRQTLAPKPTNANRLVADMEELIRRTAGPEIAVEIVAAAGLWTTLVDPNQLENALLNLCINARDAMPDGGRLTIGTGNCRLDQRAAAERDLPPGEYVSLSVSDDGAGMPPDVIARAFDPFFTTKPIGMGTGLGLSMVYGFARQSSGQARIHSEAGRGTTVRLYLPRHIGEEQAVPLSPELAGAPRAQAGQTVLVVDDEPTVRMLVAEILEDLGYAAIEAADGASGLGMLQSSAHIDLLVTDVGLPGGMNGRQMADAARAMRPGLKVLFITGYAENAALSHGQLEPGMHVLTKPFALEALASRIRDLIGDR